MALPDEAGGALRRVLAPNPSALTGTGTNTWLLSDAASGEVTVIDPGPDDPRHLAAILAALLPGSRVTQIVVTHAHADHAGLAPALARATGAPVMAFGPAEAGRDPLLERLAAEGLTGGGEGAAPGFAPDLRLAGGDRLAAGGGVLEVLHTPGHFAGHLCLALGDVLFSGDHVMGWSTTLVSPPDGDMGAYMASLDRLASVAWRRLLPGHGPAVEDPASRIADLVRHRRTREAAILAALAEGPAGLQALTARVYADTPPALHPAAARNAFAHLVDLWRRDRVRAAPHLSHRAVFALP